MQPNYDLIALFEKQLPQDLIPIPPTNYKLEANNSGNSSLAHQEDYKGFQEMRAFLLEAAARDYFNRTIRPVLERYIEIGLNTEENGVPPNTSWIPKNLKKYINMLEENDELRKRYKNIMEDFSDFGINLY